MQSSIYIHVPFCMGTCDYCDFYSVAADPEDKRLDLYVKRILEDVSNTIHSEIIMDVPSVYIGGGTPSFLGAKRMDQLLGGLNLILPNAPTEITIEANPESIDRDFLNIINLHGVTRLSVGIQSRNPASRKAIGRRGSLFRIEKIINDIHSFFVGSLSLDLIAGLPGQDEASLMDDIVFVTDSGADHVSLYALGLEETTPLHTAVRDGFVSLPDQDAADELWIQGRDALEKLGFLQYEVSNFAIPGSECTHNQRYWHMENYIGCGPGAVGTIIDETHATARRISVPKNVDAWLYGDLGATAVTEHITRNELIAECLIMGFRIVAGLDDTLMAKRFGAETKIFIPNSLKVWRDRGLAELDRPALTRSGLLFLNRFLIDCLTELDFTLMQDRSSIAGTSG